MSDEETEQAPVLRVITPDATPAEVAAILTVVQALAAGSAGAPAKPPAVWSAPGALHRRTPHAGPGAWRASGLPR